MSKARNGRKLLDFGPEDFAARTNVSRETLSRLKAYAGLLIDWNTRHNLVSAGSLEDLWQRHFWDSAQLTLLIPKTAKTLADMGSGAGFPGLVLAEMLRGQVAVTLYEATAKKCTFLVAAAERMEIPVTIRNTRIEDAPPQGFDVITARACAPLPKLLSYAQRLTGQNSVCLLSKGQNLGSELTQAHKSWNMMARQIPSLTDPSGMILEVKNLSLKDWATDDLHPQKTPHPGGRQPKGRRG